MILCVDGHEEIIYNSGECPLCKCIAEIEELEWKADVLEDEVDDLRRELNNLAG